MMEIAVENLSKRFNLNWIFRDIHFVFKQGKSYAVTGPNGSGKSTFLQVISGMVPFSKGTIAYNHNNTLIPPDRFFSYLSFCSPALELIEEFTLIEHLEFHFRFKKLRSGVTVSSIIEKLGLKNAGNREIRFFSSGMKQRVKLALAFFADTPVLILDEPTSNLDKSGIQWYLQEVKTAVKDRLVIIGSNIEAEYEFCDERIVMG